MEIEECCDLLPNAAHFLDLYTAASIGCKERVQAILDNMTPQDAVDQFNKHGWSALMYAASCANLNIVFMLIEKRANVNLKNAEGHTSLILAVKCGSLDVVRMLLEKMAMVNDQDNKGWSALHHAAAFGHRSIAQLLIEKGALINQISEVDRFTPLMIASTFGHEMIANDLLQQGANFEIKSKNGETAYGIATRKNYIKIKNLIESQVMKCCQQINLKGSNQQSVPSNLYELLKSMQLLKYYPVFESHGIDLDTFWTLCEEDLKKIGIQLIGPRKKICLEIERRHQKSMLNGNVDYVNKLVIENDNLQRQLTELNSELSQEKLKRAAAEQHLNEAVHILKDYVDRIQRTVSNNLLLQDKLKETYNELGENLISIRQSVNRPVQAKSHTLLQLAEYTSSLMEDVYKQTMLLLQSTSLGQ